MGTKGLRIRFAPEAARFIANLHPENRKIIRQAVDQIRRNPYSGHGLQEELSGFKSLKSKRYRIIHKIDERGSSVDVYFVGHRRDVYEQFRVLLRSLKQASRSSKKRHDPWP
jgi:mRNA-degrading endonuclease RelE of RelBE toxin-antitoxin system